MSAEPGSRDPAELRPITYTAASALNLAEARERYDELTGRDLCARTAARLRDRGEFDPDKLGHRVVAEAAPLTAEDRLELMSLGEVLARYYRHPAMLDHAAKAGASWEQIGAARGTSADQARQDYREWAQGQHDLLTCKDGRFGMSDADYAAALARSAEPETCPDAGGPASGSGLFGGRRLCAHADQDGKGAHWLEPGRKCADASPTGAARDLDREAGR